MTLIIKKKVKVSKVLEMKHWILNDEPKRYLTEKTALNAARKLIDNSSIRRVVFLYEFTRIDYTEEFTQQKRLSSREFYLSNTQIIH